MPSPCASSLSNSRCCSSRSSARPSVKPISSPDCTARLMWPTALLALLRRRELLRVVDAPRRAKVRPFRSRLAPDVIDQADVLRLLEREQRADRHQLDRLGLADQPREPLRAAGARQHAERHFGHADLAAALPRDADVGRHRHLEPAADGVAVERGDHELRRLLEPVQRLVGVQAEVVLEGGSASLSMPMLAPAQKNFSPAPVMHDDVDGRHPCAPPARPRPAPASSRRSRCWPADRSA